MPTKTRSGYGIVVFMLAIFAITFFGIIFSGGIKFGNMPMVGADHNPTDTDKDTYLLVVEFSPSPRQSDNHVKVTVSGHAPVYVTKNPFNQTVTVPHGSQVRLDAEDHWPGMRFVECTIYQVDPNNPASYEKLDRVVSITPERTAGCRVN